MLKKVHINSVAKTECCSNIFSLTNIFIILVSTDCSLVIIKSGCLNPNFNSIAVDVLQSVIIDKARFS